MPLMQRLGLILVAIAFSFVLAVGVARVLDARNALPPAPLAPGAGLMLLGLAGMVACRWLWLRAQARREQQIQAALAFSGQRFEARARWLARLILLLAFVAVSAVLVYSVVRQPSWGLAGLTAFWLLLTALIAALLFSMHRSGGPTLVLDAAGIEHGWIGRIPWEQVHGIALVQNRTPRQDVHSLALGVDGAERFRKQVPVLARWIARAFAPAERIEDVIHLPLENLDKDPRQVHAAAVALRGRITPGTIPSWHPRLSRADFQIAEELRRLEDPESGLSPDEIRDRLRSLEPKVRASHERALREGRDAFRKAWAIIGASVLAILAVAAHVMWKSL